jgi:GNAT superfamily N-acetyltransferase
LTYDGPDLLTGEHAVAGFDCGIPALDYWLGRRALANQATGASRTWVVTDREADRVVAFYAASTGSIIRSAVPSAVARNQPSELPAVVLARIAVDTAHQQRGLGAAMLKHFMSKAIEVAASVGGRLVLVHARDDQAKAFYRHHGFMESPIDPLTLMMLLPRP